MVTKPTGNPVGRPSIYSEATAEEICTRLVNGETLIGICEDEHMPRRETVTKWLTSRPDFYSSYVLAREQQADYMSDLIVEMAHNSTNDTSGGDNVRLKAYQWRAETLNPRRYAKKVGVGGADDLPPVQTQQTINVAVLSIEQLEALQAALTGSGKLIEHEEEGEE